MQGLCLIILVAMAVDAGAVDESVTVYGQHVDNLFGAEVVDGAIIVDLDAMMWKVGKIMGNNIIRRYNSIRTTAQLAFRDLKNLTLIVPPNGYVSRGMDQKSVIQNLIRGWRRGKGATKASPGVTLTLRLHDLKENINWPALLGEFGDRTSNGISAPHSLRIIQVPSIGFESDVYPKIREAPYSMAWKEKKFLFPNTHTFFVESQIASTVAIRYLTIQPAPLPGLQSSLVPLHHSSFPHTTETSTTPVKAKDPKYDPPAVADAFYETAKGAVTVDIEVAFFSNRVVSSKILQQYLDGVTELTLKFAVVIGEKIDMIGNMRELIRGWRRGKGSDDGVKLTLRVTDLSENIDWAMLLGAFGHQTSDGISGSHSLHIIQVPIIEFENDVKPAVGGDPQPMTWTQMNTQNDHAFTVQSIRLTPATPQLPITSPLSKLTTPILGPKTTSSLLTTIQPGSTSPTSTVALATTTTNSTTFAPTTTIVPTNTIVPNAAIAATTAAIINKTMRPTPTIKPVENGSSGLSAATAIIVIGVTATIIM